MGEEEKRAVLEVLESGQLAQGLRVQQFEDAFAAYCGTRYAVATSSGTAALWTALLAHGIGPGDVVITSPFTFIASANAVLYVGAKPVFVDIEPDTYCIDPRLAEAKIEQLMRAGQRVKALLPIHLYGHPADMEALSELAGRYGLTIIEDACQAHGASLEGKKVGTFGTGCFSFYPTKNITTAEGGVITTDDEGIAERARMLRNHGSRQRYVHEILGYNFRMTDLQAAIGSAQLGKLRDWTERRIRNAQFLNEALARQETVSVPQVRAGAVHVFHQYTVRVWGNRDNAAKRLTELGIGTGIHYPMPAHQQPLYRNLGYNDSLPESEAACRQVLSLPVHPGLTPNDLARIVEAVREL